MANTHIQILRSYANTAPISLVDGELAFSFVSNTLFIGNSTNNAIAIGGSANSDYTQSFLTDIDGGSF